MPDEMTPAGAASADGHAEGTDARGATDRADGGEAAPGRGSPRVTRPRARTSGRADERPPAKAPKGEPGAERAPKAADSQASGMAAPGQARSAAAAPSAGDVTTAPIERIGPPEALEVRMAAVGVSDARDVAVTYGAIGIARAEDVSVEFGAVGLAIGDEVRVGQALANSVIGGTVDMEQAASRIVIGGRVTFRRASAALVVLAGRVDGDVRTLLDWRGALVLGAAAGLVIALFRRR